MPSIRLPVAIAVGALATAGVVIASTSSSAGQPTTMQLAGASPALAKELQRLDRVKVDVMRRQNDLLASRYELSGKLDPVVRMSGGRKPIPVGPTARLAKGMTWDALAALSADDIKKRNLFPYLPLPHPLEPDGGGMVFPPSQLKSHPELDRVDVAFDIPDAYLPEFPPPLFLTTHPELGDVSHGKEVTIETYYPLLKDILTPLQLDGMRLLVTPFPQQQFNQTDDRVAWSAQNAVACFSCHVNGHTTGQFHRVPDVRPHRDRPRIETVSLRGVFAQRTFGSKRNLRSLEDFTEVENNTAYFDGSDEDAKRKGARHFDRQELAAMAAAQNIIAFPPAPKLTPTGDLDRTKATPAELRGEAVFRGKGQCAGCHAGAYFTDNLSHDLEVERFYAGRAEGIFKTFSLRGVKDSPPYLHDGRLLTLEDTVEFFNLVLGTRLSVDEKRDLVAYLRVL
jgi:mono/diheme cytochrome c family protein